ncbi:MAG: plasmid stabilization system [Bacteroidetes bacterium]|nr:plasmid stabilization system [Bacteroidota bacterium]
MILKLIIKEEAYKDIQTAHDYYEEQQNGLGDQFVEEVKEKIAYVRKYPLHFQKVYKEFRQILIDRFPYLLIYEISDKEIIVYSFFHTSQDPIKKFR